MDVLFSMQKPQALSCASRLPSTCILSSALLHFKTEYISTVVKPTAFLSRRQVGGQAAKNCFVGSAACLSSSPAPKESAGGGMCCPRTVLFVCTAGLMAEGLVFAPAVSVEHQEHLCCTALYLVAINSNNSFELPGLLAMLIAKSCSLQ